VLQIRPASVAGRLTLEIEDDGKGGEREPRRHRHDGCGYSGHARTRPAIPGEMEVRFGQRGVLVRAAIPEPASSLD
jgi:hypothetical protein